MTSSTKYIEPEWSAKPLFRFWLDVLKDGKIVETIPLSDKNYFLVGKQDDICDIVLAHPSVSREHAVFQFRSDGALLIKDLNSGNGTSVNKTILVKDSTYNSEDVGTFQVLHSGDFIRFGASSRQFIVGCDCVSESPSQALPEYDSQNMQKYRQHLQDKSVRAAEQRERATQKENEGVSWGFDDDAEAVLQVEGDEEDHNLGEQDLPEYLTRLKRGDPNYDSKHAEAFTSSVLAGLSRAQEAGLTEKQRDLVARIRTRERKLHHLQEESRRLLYKESSQVEGLTATQSSVLARIEAKVVEVLAEVGVAEDALAQSLYGPNSGSSSGKNIKVVSQRQLAAERRCAEYEQEEGVLDVTDCQAAGPGSNWRARRKAASTVVSKASTNATSSASTTTAGFGVSAITTSLSLSVPVKLHHSDPSQTNLRALSCDEIRAILDKVRAEHETLLSDLQAQRLLLETCEKGASANDGEDEVDRCVAAGSAEEARRSVDQLLLRERDLIAQLKYYNTLHAAATPALPSLVAKAVAGTSTVKSTVVDATTSDVATTQLKSQSVVGVSVPPVVPRYVQLADKNNGGINGIGSVSSKSHTKPARTHHRNSMSLSSCAAAVEELKRCRDGNMEDSSDIDHSVVSGAGDTMKDKRVADSVPLAKKRAIGPSLPSAAEAAGSMQQY